MKARTIKEISGACIETIPAGTEFKLKRLGKYYSSVDEGIPLTLIYNDEFVLIDEVQSA